MNQKENWLYVIFMSRTSFRVNLHSIVRLNVKKLLARIRRHIWSLSDSSEIWTDNHLVSKRTFIHLAKVASLCKRLSFRLQTKWLWVRISFLSLKKKIVYSKECSQRILNTILYFLLCNTQQVHTMPCVDHFPFLYIILLYNSMHGITYVSNSTFS